MRSHFYTIRQAAHIEHTVKKSRFIAYAKPVSDEEQALAFLYQLHKQHHAAAHHCYAYVLDETQHKQSDDGEPNGTAGKPILEAIKHLQLIQTMVIVTRYFGGTLLGTGGLIRAYGEAAALALTSATPIEQHLHVYIYVEIDYVWFGKMEHECRTRQIPLGDTVYAERITMCLMPLSEKQTQTIALVTDWTQGQAKMTVGEQFYRTLQQKFDII